MDDSTGNSNQPPGIKIDTSSPTLRVRKRIFGTHTTKLGGIATSASTRIKQFVTRQKPASLPQPTPVDTAEPPSQPNTQATTRQQPQPIARFKAQTSTAEPPPRQAPQPNSQVPTTQTQARQVTAAPDEQGNPRPTNQLPVTSQTPLSADHTPAQDTDHPDIKKIIADSNEVLISVKTVFPFNLFPDTITVDRLKVSIQHQDFFFVSNSMSIRIEDLLTVTANTGPFLGSITIASRVLTEGHFTITNLWRHDALRIKSIIQGYIIANHNGVDCTHLPKDQLIATLTELGQNATT